jgi:hypothetical protein
VGLAVGLALSGTQKFFTLRVVVILILKPLS